MRNKLLPLACMAIATANLQAAERVTLVFDEDFAPYAYVEKGQLKGIYPEMIRKALPKLAPSYEVVLAARPWKRALAEVESGNVLGIVGPYYVKERTFISTYSTPLFRESVVLYCNEDVMKLPRKRFPEDFSGVSIGVNAGFMLAESIKNAVDAGKITLQEAKGNDANLHKLAAKRIGCYASDRDSAAYSLRQMKADPAVAGFRLVEATEIAGQDVYIGYSAKVNASFKADFIKRMDESLEELKKSGEAAKISAAYK